MEVNFIRAELNVYAMNYALLIHDYGINTLGWLFKQFNISFNELSQQFILRLIFQC